MTLHECPKCGCEMEIQEADPDVGVMSAYWFCSDCEHTELAETDDSPDIDRP